LSPAGALSYTFSSGSAVVSPTANTVYTITGSSGPGCVGNATASIFVSLLPYINVNSGTICAGNSFSIVPAGADSYSISGGSSVVHPATSSSYTVWATRLSGCPGTASAISHVSVYALPVVTAAGGSVCPGAQFTIAPTGADSYSYSGGSALVSPVVSSTYSVYGSSANGCMSASPAIVKVTVFSPENIPITTENKICAGNDAVLIATGAESYTWSTGLQSSSITVNAVDGKAYAVKGIDARGCLATGSLTLKAEDCTSLSGSEGEIALNLYPNPNQGEFRIDVPQDSKMLVYNLGGFLLRSGYLVKGSNPVSLKGMPMGLYVIQIVTGNKKHGIKVILQ
jgi:hypothetical protein